MSTFIGLLRGINVGGKNKIKMAVLTEILTAVGLKDLTTYIQSGNLVFKSTRKPPAIERLIKKSISDQLGLEVPVFVRDASFFENVFADNPYRTREITSLCASFFSDKPDKALIDGIRSGDYGPDEHTIKPASSSFSQRKTSFSGFMKISKPNSPV